MPGPLKHDCGRAAGLSPRDTGQEARDSNAQGSLQGAALMRGTQTKEHQCLTRALLILLLLLNPPSAYPIPTPTSICTPMGPLGGTHEGSRACPSLLGSSTPGQGARLSETCPLLTWGSHYRPWYPQISSSPCRGWKVPGSGFKLRELVFHPNSETEVPATPWGGCKEIVSLGN